MNFNGVLFPIKCRNHIFFCCSMNVQQKIQLLKTDFMKLYPLNFSTQLIATHFSGNGKFCTEAFKLITIWIHRLPLILIFEISIRCNKARTVIPSTFQQHKRYVVTAGCCSRVTCPVEIVCFREKATISSGKQLLASA